MSSRISHSSHAKPLPFYRCAQELPPFWELEDLIASGFDRDTALAILAVRRERGDRSSLSTRPRPPAIAIFEDIGDIAF